MRSLYVSQQGCYLSLQQETLLIKQGQSVLNQVQLPLVEQILIFGKSQVTTQAIRACLERDIPIVYLSRMGYCYGRLLPIARGYRQLARYQQQLSALERLLLTLSDLKERRFLRNSLAIVLKGAVKPPLHVQIH
jgi:CRISPR-associated protein Cas1